MKQSYIKDETENAPAPIPKPDDKSVKDPLGII